MLNLEYEILTTAMDAMGKASGLDFNFGKLFSNMHFKDIDKPEPITTINDFNNYVKDVVIAGLHEYILDIFNRQATYYIGKGLVKPADDIIKDIDELFRAKEADITNHIIDMPRKDFENYNCNLDWLESDSEKINASCYFRSSLQDCVRTIFADILDIINSKNVSKERLEEAHNNVVISDNYNQQNIDEEEKPKSRFNLDLSGGYEIPIPTNQSDEAIVDQPTVPPEMSTETQVVNTTAIAQQLIEEAENAKAFQNLITRAGSTNAVNFTPGTSELITPKYDDELINKHILIDMRVLIKAEDKEAFRQTLLGISNWIEEFDKTHKLKKASRFGFSKFKDISNFELTKLVTVSGKESLMLFQDRNLITLSVVNNIQSWYQKDKNNLLIPVEA